MIIALLLLLALSAPSEQNPPVKLPLSPCPNVFNYEPEIKEVPLAKRWYGNIKLETDVEIDSLWLTIILDNKANSLSTDIGVVATKDNKIYKIENTDLVIRPGKPANLRFYVQFSSLEETPKLHVIKHNGKEICNSSKAQPIQDVVTELSHKPILVTTVPTPTINTIQPGQNLPSGENNRLPENQPNWMTNNSPVQNPPGGSNNIPDQATLDLIFNNNPGLNLNSGASLDRPLGNTPPREVNNSKPGLNQSGVNSNRPDPIVLDWNNNYTPGVNQPSGGVNINRPGLNQPFELNNNNHDVNDDFPRGTIEIILPSGPQSDNTDNYRPQGGNIGIYRPIAPIKCGTVATTALPLVVEGTPAEEGKWPWQVAMYASKGAINNVFLCGGSLVSHRHVITAGHCVIKDRSKQVIEKEVLMIYLGRHNLRLSGRGMQIRPVKEIYLYPDYDANRYKQDLAILEFWEPVQYTDVVRPVCLWPASLEDQRYVVGQYGAVVGWGADRSGTITGGLNLVIMPVIDENTCLKSHEFFTKFSNTPFTYCAGYRNGTSVCNGDSGGGMVFRIGDAWYLRGLVSLSIAQPNQRRCDPSYYTIFTDLAKYLPWIQQHVFDY